MEVDLSYIVGVFFVLFFDFVLKFIFFLLNNDKVNLYNINMYDLSIINMII